MNINSVISWGALGGIVCIGFGASAGNSQLAKTCWESPANSPAPFLSSASRRGPYIPLTAYDGEIRAIAQANKVDPLLVKAIISVESEFDARSVSSTGACGLMQLMPQTARLLQVQDVFDPADNIRGGVHHLRYLLHRFHNRLPLAIAAYNAGERSVLRYHGVPPYIETQAYVRQVLQTYAVYKTLWLLTLRQDRDTVSS